MKRTTLPLPTGPLKLEGKSLVPLLRDPAAAMKDHVLHVYPRGTPGEFLPNQPDPAKAPARFTAFDVDKDGVLSRGEFVAGGQPRP